MVFFSVQQSGLSPAEGGQELAPKAGFAGAAVGGQQGQLALGEPPGDEPLGLLFGDGVQGGELVEEGGAGGEEEIGVGEDGVQLGQGFRADFADGT